MKKVPPWNPFKKFYINKKISRGDKHWNPFKNFYTNIVFCVISKVFERIGVRGKENFSQKVFLPPKSSRTK